MFYGVYGLCNKPCLTDRPTAGKPELRSYDCSVLTDSAENGDEFMQSGGNSDVCD